MEKYAILKHNFYSGKVIETISNVQDVRFFMNGLISFVDENGVIRLIGLDNRFEYFTVKQMNDLKY